MGQGRRWRRAEKTPFEELSRFARFWCGGGKHTPCCQTADAEVIETDGAQFDCATCPLAEQWATLGEENVEAWCLFQRVCSRFAVETHVAPAILARAIADADDPDDLTTRLTMLYDIHFPPKQDRRG
jgi:hypothetical protein